MNFTRFPEVKLWSSKYCQRVKCVTDFNANKDQLALYYFLSQITQIYFTFWSFSLNITLFVFWSIYKQKIVNLYKNQYRQNTTCIFTNLYSSKCHEACCIHGSFEMESHNNWILRNQNYWPGKFEIESVLHLWLCDHISFALKKFKASVKTQRVSFHTIYIQLGAVWMLLQKTNLSVSWTMHYWCGEKKWDVFHDAWFIATLLVTTWWKVDCCNFQRLKRK